MPTTPRRQVPNQGTLSLLASGRRHPLPTQNGSMPNATRGQQCFAGGILHLVQANAHTVPEHCSEQVDASRRVRGCARVGRRHRRRHGRRKQLPVVELVLQVHTGKRARCKDRDPAQRLIYSRASVHRLAHGLVLRAPMQSAIIKIRYTRGLVGTDITNCFNVGKTQKNEEEGAKTKNKAHVGM